MGFSLVHCLIAGEVFLLATLLLFLINFLEKRGTGPYPSVAFISVGVLYLYYVFTAMLLWLFPHVGVTFRERFGYGYEHYLPSMWIGLAAMAFTYLGYRLSYGKKERPFGRLQEVEGFLIRHKERLFLAGICLFAVHLVVGAIRQKMELVAGYGAGNIYEMQRNRTGNIFNLLYDLSSFAFPIILFVSFISRRRWMHVVTTLLFVIQIGAAIFAGGILALFGAVVPILVLFLYKGFVPYREGPFRRINLAKLIVVSMVGLFFAITMKDLVRSFVNLGFKPNLVVIVENFPLFLSVFKPADIVEHIVMGFVKEISGADILSLIFHKIEGGLQDFRFGTTYLMSFVSFVPSLLWTGKPEITQSTWFADNYWFTYEDILRIGTGVQGNNFLLPGEAVFNFGYYFIPVVMFVYGCLIGFISKHALQPRQLQFVGYLLLCRLFFDLIHPATTFAALFSNCIKQFVLVLFVLFVLKYAIMIWNSILGILNGPTEFQADRSQSGPIPNTRRST